METFDIDDVIDGQFKITRVLGVGGMGMVLAATRPGLDSLVAIKVLLPELRDRADVAGRFEREARVADTLTSEHVARVQGVGKTPAGTPYIVMEHLTGTNLAAHLAKRGRLDVPEAVGLILQGCEAIAEAHTHGIVHRDLKPANLFVTTNVDGPFVKVLDFGIAKVSSPDDLVRTDTTAFFGSPLYMSPEQLAASKNVDARTDIWALGVILYELLAGTPPFNGETIALVHVAIIGGKYEPLSKVRPDIAPEIDALIAEMLALKPESRCPSVEAFAKKLAPFGGEEARRSYERILRFTGGATQGSVSTGAAQESPALGETAAPRSGTLVPLVSKTADLGLDLLAPIAEKYAPELEAPPPPTKSPRVRVPALLGIAGVAIAGTVFGLRHVHGGSPAATAPSSTPVSESAPSASASTAPAPSASIDVPAVASSASSAPAPVVSTPAFAPPANAPISKAVNECAKGATKACEAACAAHLPGRCEALARALVKGNGAPKDIARAEKLFRTECDAGAGSDCNSLGILYGSGNGVTQDNAKAITFYKQGCEHDDRMACTNLGSMHYDGTGVPKNPTLGITYFLRACPSSGPVEPEGCLNLSKAYAKGLGVPKDPVQAVAYATQACTSGAAEGCTRISTAKLTGDGIPQDVKRAVEELDNACTRREPTACKELVTVYSVGIGTEVPRDEARYRIYLDKACKANDSFSCRLRDQVSRNDNQETNIALNTAQLETTCTAGLLSYCGFLGERLLPVPADHARGISLLDKSCKGGVTRSCQSLAAAQR